MLAVLGFFAHALGLAVTLSLAALGYFLLAAPVLAAGRPAGGFLALIGGVVAGVQVLIAAGGLALHRHLPLPAAAGFQRTQSSGCGLWGAVPRPG